ncbi:MAG: hypothetical protein CMF45_03540 [Legionellales bacterium]|nr:hypothetical protein [Legionellales bacterium]
MVIRKVTEDKIIKKSERNIINIEDVIAFYRILKKLKFRLPRICLAGITLAVLEIIALLLLASFVNTALQQPKVEGISANVLEYFHLSALSFAEQSIVCVFVFILRFFAGLSLQNYILLQSAQLQTALRLLLFRSAIDNRGLVTNEEQKASGAISDVIVRQVTHLGKGILEPFLRALGELVILLGILSAVFFVSPIFLLLMMLVITPIFLFYILKFKGLSRRFGDKSNQSLEELSELSAAFCAGWRQLCVPVLHINSVSMLSKSSADFARNDRLANLLSGAPRYFLELFLAIFLIVIVAWTSYSKEMGFPELVFLAGAGLRILPIVTSISNAFISFQYNRAVLNNVVNMLDPYVDKLLAQSINRKGKEQAGGSSVGPCSIVLQNISFKYHLQKPLFEGLSEEFHSGDFVLIKGKSGIGKTTLMDVICGIRSPTSGRILFNGMQHRTNSLLPLDVFYLPQEPLIIPKTILENVSMLETEYVSKSQEERVISCLKQVGLLNSASSSNAFLNSKVGPDGDKLSGGQKQRLVLARALYHGAEVLALDEIVSGLEVNSKRQVLELLKDLAAANKLVILISHDQIAEEFASKCLSL